jgi:outer membrane protein TolC
MTMISCAVLTAACLAVPLQAEDPGGPGWEKPITLDQALEIAFRRSPEIHLALDELQKSAGGVSEAKANFMPRIDASLEHFRQEPAFTLDDLDLAPREATTATAVLSIPLDVSGGLRFVSDIAKYRYQLDCLSLQSASQKLILDVKRAYLEVLRAKGRQEVAQAAVDVAARRLKDSKDRFAVGTVAQFDVSRGEVDVANLNMQLIQAKAGVAIAHSSFNRALGIAISSPTELAGFDTRVKELHIGVAESTAEAIRRRPEVKSAETAVLLSAKNIKLQQTMAQPSLGMSLQGNYNEPAYGFTTDHTTWVAAALLKVPIWDGGVTKANVDQARADRDKARDGLEQLKLAIALEVQTAAVGLQEATERVRTALQNVQLAETALNLANDRYSSGVTILVEVADAESALTQAKFNAVQAEYDYAVALAELERATCTQPEAQRLRLIGDRFERGEGVCLATTKQSS